MSGRGGMALLAALALGGCTDGGGDPGPDGAGTREAGLTAAANEIVTTLLADSQCPGDGREPAARWLDDRAALERFLAALAQKRGQPAAAPAPAVDFAARRLLLVDMGERPTAGYRVAVAVPELRLAGEEAALTLDWIEPPKGAMLAQVMTRPCVLVSLPRLGFARLRLVDRDGRERLSITP